MARLSPERSDAFLAACRAAGAEANEAFQRTLGTPCAMTVGDAANVRADALPAELAGPGLVVVFVLEGAGAILAIPEAAGLIPGWCAAPDVTGQSKLATLAQELGMLLLPEDCMPDDAKTLRVESLAAAIRRGGLGDGAMRIALNISSSGKDTAASLIWPIADPAKAVVEKPAAAKPAAQKPPAAKPQPPVSRGTVQRPTSLQDLPHFSRSLLKVRVPVRVTLAEKRQSLERIIELGPGTIIQFEKSCEESLDLEVGNCRIAAGEAVKVGDKFGLRITSIMLPDERFLAVKPPKAG